MSKVVPVLVKSMDELQEAINRKSAVIVINNSNISKKVQEISDKDVEAQKKANDLLKFGGKAAGASVGLLILGLIGESFFWQIGLIAGIGSFASFMASGLSLAAGSGKKILNAISNELKDYKWFEQNKKTILYKYQGANKFDPNVDEVEAYKG